MSRLQELRKSTGLSQPQLAEKSGVSLSMIRDYEQGRRSLNGIGIARALPLARALGVSIEDLIED